MNSVTQLTQLFTPSDYQLTLDIDRQDRSFNGTVTLTGNLKKQDDCIQLHSKDLEISAATINGLPASWNHNVKTDTLSLSLEKDLSAGEHKISITFSGQITDTLHGLYPGYYKKDGQAKELLVTQLESHHARELFPCIDEPAAKATFSLTIITEQGRKVIANTPIASEKTEGQKTTTVFEPTPKMSTYLLAFVIGELDYLEAKTTNGTVVRTYATEGQAPLTQFALDVAVQSLEFYNEFFDEPYPLPKCDLLAVPDFSAGAMENWGCVTFRESALLLDPQLSDATTKQWVAQVVIHELAHQWFGNLVTMQWWNDLWLNEGFARFMESYVADQLFPEWHLDIDFIATNSAYAMRLDALASTHSIQVEIHHPDEISTIFDAISYEKGAAAIRMLQHYLGETDFRKGLQLYIKNHKYGNTITNDLWKALSEVSGRDVASFMQPWITQPGFPVVELTEQDNALQISQHRFYASPIERKADDKTLWPIPLLSEDDSLPKLLAERSTNASPTKLPIFLNDGQTGFYIVNYTPEQRQSLAEEVKKQRLSTANRLGLLSDSFELAKAGYLPTTETLRLLEAYSQEDDHHVWSTIGLVIGTIRQLLDNEPSRMKTANAFIQPLVSPQLEKLGWKQRSDEPENTRLQRQLIVGLATRAEIPAAIETALQLFDASPDGKDIEADIRPIVYATAVRKRGTEVVKALLDRHSHTDFDEERTNLALGVCATTNPDDIALILDYIATDKNVKSQNLSYWFAYLMRNPDARKQTWDWMRQKWDWIAELFAGDKSYDHFARYAAQTLMTPEELAEYRAFFGPKGKADASLTRAVDQGIESITLRLTWIERDREAIVRYLETSSTQ